jgi:hypothetical protein
MTPQKAQACFLSTMSEWVGVEQGLVFAMERPPFFTPLAGASMARRLDIDLDLQTRLAEIRRLISSGRAPQ